MSLLKDNIDWYSILNKNAVKLKFTTFGMWINKYEVDFTEK